MMPGVSIVILYRDRVLQIVKTLESIRRQRYPGQLEIIVIEDGDDGGYISGICRNYGARHIQCPREAPVPSGRFQYWTKNPPFGNLPVKRNLGIREAQHDIIIFQDAEVQHDTNVIGELSDQVKDNSNVLVNCSMKLEEKDGRTWTWRSHPTDGPCPRWPHVGAPNCAQRSAIQSIGGFEELMAGYGYDDDYFFRLVRENGIELRMTADSVSTHQWHEPMGFYDYPTSRANRALCARLCHEISKGLRPPKANDRAREVLDSAFPTMNREILKPVLESVKTEDADFKAWRAGWLQGTYDEHANLAREMAEKMMQRKYDTPCCYAAAETAWGVREAENALEVGAKEPAEHLLSWARTAATICQRGVV